MELFKAPLGGKEIKKEQDYLRAHSDQEKRALLHYYLSQNEGFTTDNNGPMEIKL